LGAIGRDRGISSLFDSIEGKIRLYLKRKWEVPMPTDILSTFENRRYADLAMSLRAEYVSAYPFPHIVIDDFLPSDVAQRLALEYPSPDFMAENWKCHSNENVERYFLENTARFPPSMRLFASAITSRSFLLFLETLTGIASLLPDPYFLGGGAMVTGNGGFLRTHVDFNWHQKLQAWRRCNALFYLTPDWDSKWGGDLELWETDGSKLAKCVSPKFNRVVIFSTTKNSFHGQPQPLNCPPNVYRRVFSAFYYCSNRSELIDEDPHYTRYGGTEDKRLAGKESSPYVEMIMKDYLKNGL
jgi:Rps23 Pro-64 3,4-dihydroxylase Tpa1-like proline 4-hydroxylase